MSPSRNLRFAGRVGIVTGSSSGIGRAIALELAREGAIIMCADLRSEANPNGWESDVDTPTHMVIRDNGGKASFTTTDMGQTSEIEHLISTTVKVCSKLNAMPITTGTRKARFHCQCCGTMASLATIRRRNRGNVGQNVQRQRQGNGHSYASCHSSIPQPRY
jgi:hypothetical protein